jgi:trimeric autotransporter adhesin
MKANLGFRAFVLAAFGLALGASILFAQQYQGGVRGLIQDPGGAVIPNAKVTLVNTATTVSRSTLSNAQGEYVFSQVDPATYTISVEAPGFTKLDRTGVIIGTQQFLTIDLKMEVGEVSSSVQVTEEVPLLESSNASNGQVLDTQKLTDLPNLGRNPFLLSKLSTNVVTGGDPRFNRFQDQSGSSQISIAGGPVRGNNYTIDGVPITDSYNRAVIIPSIEATQEMKLQTGTYDATMGRTGGGVFNTVLKSGTNEIHGSLLGYTRQTDWLANNFFYNAAGTPRPDTPFYTWAGSFGGPVVIPKLYNGRNKTFFYLATESYRQKSPLSSGYALPTPLEAQGNYSQSSATIYNPLSARACTAADNCPAGVSMVRTPFPGNVIPASMINPVGAAIMSYLPTGATGFKTDATNFTGFDTLTDRADEYTAKADQTITDWWRLSAYYMHYKSREPGGNTLGSLPGGSSPYLLFRKVDATAVNSIMTLNPTTVLTLRYGFNRFPNLTYGISYGFNPGSLGLPANYVDSLQANYFPEIDLINNKISGTSPSVSVFYSKNVMASISKYIGRHNITAGFDYRLIHTDFISESFAAGDFAFNGVFSGQYPNVSNGTGADFADLLMGYPSSGSVSTSTKLYEFVRYYAGYVQDDFRVNSKLTLNLGIRYEYETGISENNNAFVVGFDRSAMNPIGAGLGIATPGVIQYAGVNGNPSSCCNPPWYKFGPRVGIAYQLNPKTVIRAGWGIFYNPTIFSTDGSLVPGYTQSTTYVASNNGNATPANSLSNPFPSGILQPVGNTLGPLTAIGSTFNYFDQNRTAGVVHQFSFDIQRELAYGIVVEAGYIGARSYHLQPAPTLPSGSGYYNLNQVPSQYLPLGSQLSSAVANPFYQNGGKGVIGGATVSRAQLLMPYPQYSTIGIVTNPSDAQYDSLVLKAQKRLSAGLTFLATMTYSRNEDNEYAGGSANAFNGFTGSSPQNQPQNAYDLGAEWGLSAIDTPVRVTGTWTYELPFGEGKHWLNSNKWLDYAVGGWKVNGVVTYQTGFPLFIFQKNLNSVIGAGAQRPNATGVSPATSGSVEDRLNGYINPAAFSLAPAYTFGNLSRSINYLGPGTKNWDASIFKDFKIKERLSGEFRAEALNLFNSPQFANPNTQFTGVAGSFGKITYQTNLPRQLQLGVRFAF